LREFSKDFLAQIRMDCASKPLTIRFYESKLARLLESRELVDSPLDEIDEAKVEDYKLARTAQESRYGKPIAPASVNRELAVLRRLLRMAWRRKLIASVPEIKLLRGEKVREFVLSPEDEQRYFDALPSSMHDFCPFLVDTGLRTGEAIALEWTQVNLREQPGYVTVRSGTAKNSEKRTVELTPRARAVLEGLDGRAGRVFRNDAGAPLYQTWLDKQHAEVRKLLAFPEDFVLHSLRHTIGTRLGASGADVRTIMELMGHKSLRVAQRYIHPSTDAKRRSIERMAETHRVPPKSPTPLKAVKSKKHVSDL
jgi:integrase